jgi:hypothetical protein
MSTSNYQKELYLKLTDIFPDTVNEWRAFATGEKHKYGPRVDIAIGPFNVEGIPENLTSHYNRLVRQEPINRFLQKAYKFHIQNLDTTIYDEVIHPGFLEVIERNQNARCLIAIEIENLNSRKHIMGSIVNAASLGRIGIGVGFNPRAMKSFLRIINYLSFLKNVEKNGYDTVNFLVLTIDQMEALLKEDVLLHD